MEKGVVACVSPLTARLVCVVGRPYTITYTCMHAYARTSMARRLRLACAGPGLVFLICAWYFRSSSSSALICDFIEMVVVVYCMGR